MNNEENISISVIVAIYKDIEALNLIINSLNNQTYKGSYEIIVAEDGENKEIFNYIQQLPYKNIVHTTQKDLGWRKNKSLNNAIKISKGSLLIFLDGDCVPYSNLIENYSKLAKNKTILCGRRVELGEKYTSDLRSSKININNIEKNYILNYFNFMKDDTRHYEEGIIFNKTFYNLKYKNKTSHILGCNFAVNKIDITDINGFDEDYTSPSVGEDTDIELRLSLNNCKMIPARNLCNTVHLYHKITYNEEDNIKSNTIFENVKMKNEIQCNNGIVKLI